MPPKEQPELFITDRQLQVVQLLALGNTIPRVAEIMGVKPRTVKYLLEKVRLQLGRIPSRELPQVLHERGYPIYPE